MTTGQKIQSCRKKVGLTQEELAEKLGVSRQAVSKWESDLAFPETENVLQLCKLFSVSADELLFGRESENGAPMSEGEPSKADDDGKGVTWGVIKHEGKGRFEYISKRRVLGMPLVHVNLGLRCRAHGVFSFGIFSTGFVSAGIFSAGLLSAGIFAVGIIVFGSYCLGVLSFGGISLGVLAFGGVAVGTMCYGGVAVGNIAIGGLAIGKYAVGDWAHGWLAVGNAHASGTHSFSLPEMQAELVAFLSARVPAYIANIIRTASQSVT